MSRLPRRLALLALLFAPPLAPAAPPPNPPPEKLPPFETQQLDATTWYGRFGITNCSWTDMGSGVLVIDTGPSAEDGRNLVAQIRKTMGLKPVRWIVMTHLHPDSNNGLAAFLPTDAALIVNARTASGVAASLRRREGSVLNVVGVSDRLVLETAASSVEIDAVPGAAHTDSDLFVFAPRSGILFAGDLVTSGRCPMMSDPNADPKGWLAALSRLDALHPLTLIPTRGNGTAAASDEIALTRSYVQRILDITSELKKRDSPEAGVTSRLLLSPVGNYCSRELDTINALSIYRRISPDGNVRPSAPAAPPSPPRPSPKSPPAPQR